MFTFLKNMQSHFFRGIVGIYDKCDVNERSARPTAIKHLDNVNSQIPFKTHFTFPFKTSCHMLNSATHTQLSKGF